MCFEATMVEHAAPTLAGLKPASLFRYQPASSPAFAQQFKQWRQTFSAAGLRLVILKGCRRTGAYLLYLYRETDLQAALEQPECRAFLLEQGYPDWADYRDCVRHLTRRLCLQEAFPHEIGVFLGYPLEDVRGFLEHKGRNYTYCGCWKAYGDPQAAEQRFARYHRCTAVLRRHYSGGVPLERLIRSA